MKILYWKWFSPTTTWVPGMDSCSQAWQQVPLPTQEPEPHQPLRNHKRGNESNVSHLKILKSSTDPPCTFNLSNQEAEAGRCLSLVYRVSSMVIGAILRNSFDDHRQEKFVLSTAGQESQRNGLLLLFQRSISSGSQSPLPPVLGIQHPL